MSTPRFDPDTASDERAGPVPWAGWRALVDVIAIYIAALILGQGLVVLATVFGLPEELLLPTLVFLSPISLLLVGIAWLRTRYGDAARQALGSRRTALTDVGLGLAFGLACFVGQQVVVASVAAALQRAGAELPQVQETFRVIAENPSTAPVLAVTAVALAPLAEEFIFRGVLFQGLRVRVGFWVAALVSAAVFTLAHLEVGGGVLGNVVVVAGILPLGLAFAAVVAYRRNLVAVAVTHATYNAIGVSLLIGTGGAL